MRYYEETDNDFIICIGEGFGGEEISETQYNEILEIIHTKPAPSSGFDYKLRADTLEWELVELPPMPEPELTDEEVLEILLGGGDA